MGVAAERAASEVTPRSPGVPSARTPEPESLRASRFVVPVPPAGLVDRPRIARRLSAGVEGPLTLVSAPAGTGKTVAVASWAHGRCGPETLVWISLEDVEPCGPELWSLVVDGLRRGGVGVPGRAPTAGDTSRSRFLTELVAAVVDGGQPVILVLDGVEDIGKEDGRALDYLVRRSGGLVRLVLVSRSDPVVPLHRYRMETAVTEVRMAELAFTPDEARALLAGRAADLSPAATQLVIARTRGWAAGLVLAAMSLGRRGGPGTGVPELTGDTGTVAEYLLSEVLDAHTAPAREILLRTSVVDVLRPGLAEALAGPHAHRALTFLQHGNAFLEPVPGTPGWLRYHPLFRELLRAQLTYEAPDELPGLHRAAASWLAENGDLDDAVRHATSAGAWEDAARYLVDAYAVGRLLRWPWGALADAVEAAPRTVAGAALELVRAALALGRGDVDTGERHLDLARTRLADEAPWPAADLAATVLAGYRALLVGDAEAALAAVSRAEQAVQLTGPAGDADVPAELSTFVELLGAAALVRLGDLDAAAHRLASAVAHAETGESDLVTRATSRLALVAAWRGQLRRARRLADETLTAADPDRAPAATSSSRAAHVALAWTCTESYDLAAARQHAERATAVLGWPGPLEEPLTHAMLTLVEARTRRARGDIHGAAEALATGQAPGLPDWLRGELLAEGAVLDLARGEAGHAVAVAEQLLAENAHGPHDSAVGAELLLGQARLAAGQGVDDVVTPPPGGAPLVTKVDGWLLEASRRLRRGQEVRAGQALERSLRLAEPEHLRRPFREAPPEVRRLLRLRDDLVDRHLWLGVIAEAPGGSRVNGGRASLDLRPAPVEQLTEKELEVLGHLAELLSTEEIAAAMFVSVNTVRTHVRNILRKLSASRRNEAVRRARDLRILPT